MSDIFFSLCGGYERCACENNTDKGFSSVHWGIQQELHWRYPAILKSWNNLGWKRPLEVIWSKLVLRASNLDQVAQGFVQSCFENLHGWRLHSLSGQLCQWLITDCNDLPLYSGRIFPLLQIVTIASCPFAMNTWEESISIFSETLLQAAGHNCEISPPPLFLWLSKPRSLSLSSYLILCSRHQPAWWPWLNSFQFVHILLVPRGQNWTQYSCKQQIERNNHFHQPAGYALADTA